MKVQSIIEGLRRLGSRDQGSRWTPFDLGRLARPEVAAAAVLLLGVGFPIVSGRFQVVLMTKFFIFAILALSLDVLWGYAGILSLGHAGFFGLGGYCAALTLIHLDGPGATYVAIAIGILVPAILAAVVGYVLFYGNVGGMGFAVITLVVAIVLSQMAITFIGVTGGLNGLYPIPPLSLHVPGVITVYLNNPIAQYYFILMCLALLFALCRWFVSSRFGRLLIAIRGNETRVEYFGYALATSKIAVFSLSCGLAGLAGALYAGSVGFISPDLMSIVMTTEILVWVAVGGRGTLSGAVLGTLLVNVAAMFLSGQVVNLWYLLMGALLVAVVMFSPKGIVGYFSKLRS